MQSGAGRLNRLQHSPDIQRAKSRVEILNAMKRPAKARKAKRPRARKIKASSLRPGRRSPRINPEESEEIVLAIRRGKIDALVMSGKDGEQVLMLQGAEHPYRVLVETINDGVATLDRNGIVLYANSRFAAILRVPSENFIGTPLQNHVLSSDRNSLQSLISEGLSNSTQGEITLNAAEGRPRLVRLALTPVKNSEPQTVCVVATELTELVEANEALRSNEESLRLLSARLLKLQDEERRHIARDLHDITGQKLAVQSMGLAQVLKRKAAVLDEESRNILSECANLNKQIGEEIRTLSYLLHPPLLDELGLSSAVKWYAEGFERRTGIKVKVDISPDLVRLPPDVEVTLFRVIQESLTNVHRYSGSPKAYVRVKVNSGEIEVQIGDFGKGMHRDLLNANTGKVAPLGVGIQGMKERMRQLSGKLEITSRPNDGTVVTATLPFSQIDSKVAAESASNAASALPTRSAEVPSGDRIASRRQILIADDHEMLRRGVRAMLERVPEWEVCAEAVDGRSAVEKAAALRPDLVILDINMPNLNGLAAVRQILRSAPQTKILVFTVHDSDQTVKEIQATGAHGYLSKSNASQDLLRVVKELLESETAVSSVV
jgi:PAS domain S-box-containing protein